MSTLFAMWHTVFQDLSKVFSFFLFAISSLLPFSYEERSTVEECFFLRTCQLERSTEWIPWRHLAQSSFLHLSPNLMHLTLLFQPTLITHQYPSQHLPLRHRPFGRGGIQLSSMLHRSTSRFTWHWVSPRASRFCLRSRTFQDHIYHFINS